MEAGQTYTIVAGGGSGEPLDAEVRIRAYADAKCKCCGAQVNEHDFSARLQAAYDDGLALGRMLREYGPGQYILGLRAGLEGK